MVPPFSPPPLCSQPVRWPQMPPGTGGVGLGLGRAGSRCNGTRLHWDSRLLKMELLPILIAGVVWGHPWSNHRVICHCDNQAVVACLHSHTSRHKGIMHLLRILLFIEAQFRFHVIPRYISTQANHLADDISCNRVFSFLSKVPHATPSPVLVPGGLVSLLMDPLADWTSPQWRRQFSTILNRD